MKEYRIPCSLKQRKGKIDYHGSIRIDGEVRGDIDIRATGSIYIGGDVNGATINCGGALTIKGDACGSEKISYNVKEDFTCNSISHIHLTSEGDVNVKERVADCKIRAIGRFNGEKALIRNSFVCALRGILAGVIESGGNKFSILTAGINFKNIERRSELEKMISKRKNEQQALLNRLGPILQKALSDYDYARRMGQDIDTEMSRVKAFSKEIENMSANLTELIERYGKDGIACISITGAVQTGTEINVGSAFSKVMENTTGPMSFIPDSHGIRPARQSGLLLEQIS